MPEEQRTYKRMSAASKKISEISQEDIRVSLLGRVVDKANGTIVIDDGSGTAEIVAESEANINDIVRIFARVLPLEEGCELRAEIVQGMNALDMDLYRKVHG